MTAVEFDNPVVGGIRSVEYQDYFIGVVDIRQEGNSAGCAGSGDAPYRHLPVIDPVPAILDGKGHRPGDAACQGDRGVHETGIVATATFINDVITCQLSKERRRVHLCAQGAHIPAIIDGRNDKIIGRGDV